MQTILKDQIAISESIEVATGDLPCSYWVLRFFGRDFAPELRNSLNGFLLRAKPHQQLKFLMEELKKNYSGLNLYFESAKGLTELADLNIEMERPTIMFIPEIEPLTDSIK